MRVLIIRLFRSIGNNSLEWFCFFVSVISITLVYHHFHHEHSRLNINRVKTFRIYSEPTTTAITTLAPTTTTTTPLKTTVTTTRITTVQSTTTTIPTTTTTMTIIFSNDSIKSVYDFDLSFISSSDWKCKNKKDDDELEDVFLVLLIKSKVADGNKRKVVRDTWGLENRFPEFKIRRVFFLGINQSDEKELDILVKEQDRFKDLVTVDFKDSQKNATLKAMSAFTWVKDFCPKSQFYAYLDDTNYVSMKYLVEFLKSYSASDEYLKYSQLYFNYTDVNTDLSEREAEPKSRLFGGALRSNESVGRSGNWAVTPQEFAFDKFPSFLNSHAIIMSREVVEEIYIASHFTRFFWMDDVFLGLCALRSGIKPVQIPGIVRGDIKPADVISLRHDKIACHIGNYTPDELRKLWDHQKAAGYA